MSRRFVLLHHDHPSDHCDLLVEAETKTVCLTWRLPFPFDPDQRPEKSIWDAERIAAHRLFYLDYEGPVSGDRGRVRRVDGGECRLTDWSDERGGMVWFAGNTLSGFYRIAAVRDQHWTIHRAEGGDFFQKISTPTESPQA